MSASSLPFSPCAPNAPAATPTKAEAAPIKKNSLSMFNSSPKNLDGLQHLSRVAARGLRDLRAGEHARDLLDLPAAVEARDADLGAPAALLLVNEQVRVREARDLRLVRHAEHLVGARERLQLQP